MLQLLPGRFGQYPTMERQRRTIPLWILSQHLVPDTVIVALYKRILCLRETTPQSIHILLQSGLDNDIDQPLQQSASVSMVPGEIIRKHCDGIDTRAFQIVIYY